MAFTRVVFPQPDGPITAFIAPRLNATLAEYRMGSGLSDGDTVRFWQLNMYGKKISIDVQYFF